MSVPGRGGGPETVAAPEGLRRGNGRWAKEGREGRKAATSRGHSHRSIGRRSVGWDAQLKRCGTVWSSALHSGHKGRGQWWWWRSGS